MFSIEPPVCVPAVLVVQGFILWRTCPYPNARYSHRQYLLWRAGYAVWLSGSALVSIIKVTLCWAWFVLGWVTGPGFNSRCRKPISAYNQPLRSTQPGHPSMDRHSEYQPKGSDAL